MTSSDAVGTGQRARAAVGVLRGRGDRVTQARRAVLEVLDSTDEHLGADEIARRATASASGVHRATVYRALATLGDLGIITHTHVGGSATVYHLSAPSQTSGPAGDHAHVQCTVCGEVIDVPVAALSALARRLERDLDFRLAPEHAALLGTCSGCGDHER